MQSKSCCFDPVCWTCLWFKLDPQTIWLILVIVFSTLSKHPSVYTLLVFLIWPETVDFWAFFDPEPKGNESFSFSATAVKAVCISTQVPKGLPALNFKSSVLRLRWTSLALCSWGSLSSVALFWSLFFAAFNQHRYQSDKPFLCLDYTSFLYKKIVNVFMCLWRHLQSSFAWVK